MWSSRDCIFSNFYHTNHLLNVSLKRKTDNISIIIRRMTTEKRARAVGILRQGAGIRQVHIENVLLENEEMIILRDFNKDLLNVSTVSKKKKKKKKK